MARKIHVHQLKSYSNMRTVWATISVLMLSCRLSSCQDDVVLLQGDVMLGVMPSMNDVRGSGCGDFNIQSMKSLSSVMWFLNQINSRQYIPSITIGLHAFRTCMSSKMAASAALQMMETYGIVGTDIQRNHSTPFLGLVGPFRTNEAIVVSRMLGSLPEDQRPLLVSGSATGESLSDRTLYPSFFRVIPPDSTQVNVLLELLGQLQWNYVAIVYADDEYGRQAASKLKDLSEEAGICVPCFASLPLDYTSMDFISQVDNIVAKIDGRSGSSPVTGVVFIGGSTTAESFVSRLAARVSYVRFVFSEALGLTRGALVGTGGVCTLGRGSLAAAPPHFLVPEFTQDWMRLWQNRSEFLAEAVRNLWLDALYQQVARCFVTNADCWESRLWWKSLFPGTEQNLFEFYHLKAVAVFAAVLKELHRTSCAGPGLCPALKNKLWYQRPLIQNVLQSKSFNLEETFSNISSAFRGLTSVRFDERGEVVNQNQKASSYDVYNFQENKESEFGFVQVGSYTPEHKLNLNESIIRGYTDTGDLLLWPAFPKSQCLGNYDCLECLPKNIPGQVVFIPGDYYFIGVAPVHDRNDDGALLCGEMRTLSGTDLVENMIFAVDQVNAKKGPFAGIYGDKKLGVIILDSCYRELVIKERMIQLYKGELMLPDGRNSSHILPYIAGVVGDYYSTTSIAIYEVPSKLEARFVHLGPSNTSPLFSDKTAFPYFLRLITKQEQFSKALFSLLREFNFTYIQVIYDPSDVYTATVRDGIVKLSAVFNVCIAQSIPTKYKEKNMSPVLDKMRQFSSASVVVVILVAQHIQKMMNQILPGMTSGDNFVFIGGSAWSRIETAVDVTNSGRLIGSLTFSQELPFDVRFGEYFSELDPLKSRNPWLKYFWEKRNACYFDRSFQRKGKRGRCPRDLARNYKQDPWTPFFINCVYAFALGLDAAMKTHCQPQGNVLCDSLTSARLRESVKAVSLDLYNTGRPVKVFDDNGDGDIGYTVFEISQGDYGGTPVYNKVGMFDRDRLTLDNKNNLLVVKKGQTSSCPNPPTCNACFPSHPPSDICASNAPYSEGSVTIVIPFSVVVIILTVAIVFCIALLVKSRRQRQKVPPAEILPMSSQSPAEQTPTRVSQPVAGEKEDSSRLSVNRRTQIMRPPASTHMSHSRQWSDAQPSWARGPLPTGSRGFNDIADVGNLTDTDELNNMAGSGDHENMSSESSSHYDLVNGGSSRAHRGPSTWSLYCTGSCMHKGGNNGSFVCTPPRPGATMNTHTSRRTRGDLPDDCLQSLHSIAGRHTSGSTDRHPPIGSSDEMVPSPGFDPVTSSRNAVLSHGNAQFVPGTFSRNALRSLEPFPVLYSDVTSGNCVESTASDGSAGSDTFVKMLISNVSFRSAASDTALKCVLSAGSSEAPRGAEAQQDMCLSRADCAGSSCQNSPQLVAQTPAIISCAREEEVAPMESNVDSEVEIRNDRLNPEHRRPIVFANQAVDSKSPERKLPSDYLTPRFSTQEVYFC